MLITLPKALMMDAILLIAYSCPNGPPVNKFRADSENLLKQVKNLL